ncbi:cytochrome c biogenesis protein CcsA [Salmonella enterica subsp. enterica serovar Infantis]|nr:cytochrome c biogenesis protein CcsA [Salmonella enterica subsp. enterica serovar Infantis]
MDAGGVGVPDAGHRARLGVGLLRAGLGRLVVLGPVENASFMPWLAGTALLHSLAVTEQRAGFKAWTLLLSICAFSLCLLGTFRCAPGCWCRCTPSPPTRRAECLSSPLWCWSPAARCCCSPCAGTGCVRG